MSHHSPIAPNSPGAIRHDGWTPERRIRFLDHLAGTGNVRAACARAGMSAEAAYRFKRRDAAFARAWSAALALAREASEEVLATRAIDGVEEELWFRGELVGTRRKYDSRLLLAHLARLDRLVDETYAGEDMGRFDELVALAAGIEVPTDLDCQPGALPPTREDGMAIARMVATGTFYGDDPDAATHDDDDDEEDDDLDFDFEDPVETAREVRAVEAEQQAAAAWDGWHSAALAFVDGLRGQDDVLSCTPSRSSTSGDLVTSPDALAGALTRPGAAALVARA